MIGRKAVKIGFCVKAVLNASPFPRVNFPSCPSSLNFRNPVAMQSAWQLIRTYYINNFLVHAVELVYGKRHAVLRPWDTSSFALGEIFQDLGHYRFAVDRLFVVHYVLDSLQQRLHSQVMS